MNDAIKLNKKYNLTLEELYGNEATTSSSSSSSSSTTTTSSSSSSSSSNETVPRNTVALRDITNDNRKRTFDESINKDSSSTNIPFKIDPLTRPTNEEIEKIRKNPLILIKYGWKHLRIFNSFYALIPPYFTKISEFEWRAANEKGALEENIDYFRVDVVPPLLIHLKRYGYGHVYRPMNVQELSTFLSPYNWRHINTPTNITSETMTIWVSATVEKKGTQPSIKNKDYFCTIGDVADYFEKVKDENITKEKSEQQLVLPVVKERDDVDYKQKQLVLPVVIEIDIDESTSKIQKMETFNESL